MQRLDSINYFWVSVINSAVILLTVLSFPNYFFFIPGVPDGFTVFSFIQLFSSAGWFLLIVVPPIMFGFSHISQWGHVRSTLFFISVLLWTVSTLIIQIIALALYGEIWLEYMIVYPIFFFMSLGAPFIYVMMWLKGHTLRERFWTRNQSDKNEDSHVAAHSEGSER